MVNRIEKLGTGGFKSSYDHVYNLLAVLVSIKNKTGMSGRNIVFVSCVPTLNAASSATVCWRTGAFICVFNPSPILTICGFKTKTRHSAENHSDDFLCVSLDTAL